MTTDEAKALIIYSQETIKAILLVLCTKGINVIDVEVTRQEFDAGNSFITNVEIKYKL